VLNAGALLAGYGAEPHEFPHMALVMFKDRLSSDGVTPKLHSQCAGTIYNENWVITAG
jgi:hypothetical protein